MQIGLQLLRIRNIVRDLAKPVQIIRKADQPCLGACQCFKSMPHHTGTHHLAKGTNMRQTRRPIASFENDSILVRTTHFIQPFRQHRGFGKWPCFGIAGDIHHFIHIGHQLLFLTKRAPVINERIQTAAKLGKALVKVKSDHMRLII